MVERLLTEFFLLAAGVTFIVSLCHAARIPTLIGFIFTGVALGPSVFGLLKELPAAHSLTEIASIVLMFTIGLEFSMARLLSLKAVFIRLGAVQVVSTTLVVALIAHFFFAASIPRAIVWGMAVSLSSTALVLKLLHDHREENSPHGQNALGVLLFQDVAVIPMMLLLPVLATFGEPVPHGISMDEPVSAHGLPENGVGYWLGQHWSTLSVHDSVLALIQGAALLLCLVAIVRLLSGWGIPRLLERVSHTRSQEVFFFALVFLALGLGELFNFAGLSLSLGAFVAGVLVSESPFNLQSRSMFIGLRDTFLGVFFAAVGMMLDLRFLGDNLLSVLSLGAGLFVLKLALLLLICKLNRLPSATAIYTALTVCQVGEFSFVMVSEALSKGLFAPEDSQYFLAVSILSMIFTPVLYGLAPWIAHMQKGRRSLVPQGSASLGTPPPTDGHTIVVGLGIAGRNVAEVLSAEGVSVVGIDSDFGAVRSRNRQWADRQTSAAEAVNPFPVVYGDAASAEVLHHAGLEHARLVVIAVSSPRALRHIAHRIRQLRPEVPLIVRAHYLSDLKDISPRPGTQFVVSELETAQKLLLQAMAEFEWPADVCASFMESSQQRLLQHAEAVSGHEFRNRRNCLEHRP
jgi:CPA2 family monovalent cation:H+ antiporter-2